MSDAKALLRLQEYHGRELTEKEIILQKFFEQRDRDYKKKLEMKQRKRLSSVDDFLQDSGRTAPLKATKKNPLESPLSERDKFVQAELLQHKKKGLMTAQAHVTDVDSTPFASAASTSPLIEDDSLTPKIASASATGVGKGEEVKKSGKSAYHISSRQKQPVQSIITDEAVSNYAPSTTSSLIGKRTRDPSSIVDDSTAVQLPPDELDPNKFPPYNLLLKTDWNPMLACAEVETEASKRQLMEAGEGAREFILPDFSMLKNQTLAFKITVPADSQRWAINIGPADPSGEEQLDEDGGAAAVSQSTEPCDYWQEILFHFNPRYAKRKEVVQAVLQSGAWTFSVRENNINKMKEAFPANNKNFTLIVQIRPDGFYTSVNGIFLSVFPHRSDITRFKHLRLQLPLTDDSGNPENAIFHKVWWGRRDVSNNRDFLGCNRAAIDASFQKTAEQARNIYIGGIPHTDNVDKLDDLRAFLLDIFDEFGAEPESLEVPPGKGFARIKLSSVEGAEDAIAKYNGFQVENEHDPDDEFTLIVAPARS